MAWEEQGVQISDPSRTKLIVTWPGELPRSGEILAESERKFRIGSVTQTWWLSVKFLRPPPVTGAIVCFIDRVSFPQEKKLNITMGEFLQILFIWSKWAWTKWGMNYSGYCGVLPRPSTSVPLWDWSFHFSNSWDCWRLTAFNWILLQTHPSSCPFQVHAHIQ